MAATQTMKQLTTEPAAAGTFAKTPVIDGADCKENAEFVQLRMI